MKRISSFRASCRAVILFAALAAAPALAHSPLQESIPADGAILAGPVRAITLVFKKPARVLKVSVGLGNGASDTETRLAIPNGGLAKKVELHANFASAGLHTVEWRALSEDGHAVTGSFRFTIKEK